MNTRLKIFTALTSLVLLAVLSVQAPVFAKGSKAPAGKHERQRYIIMLNDPPLAAYDGRRLDTPERGDAVTQLSATAGRFNAKGKLDVKSAASQQYLEFLDDRFKSFRGEALLRLGRQLPAVHRYRMATNGFATELTATEARALRELPGVKSVTFDEVQKLHTDSGPTWLGADIILNGDAGFPATGGEGTVIGVFDTGINWDHPSFSDLGEVLAPGSGSWDHVNPYGEELGLCSDPQVLCNDKLVGVYDLVEDDPDTDTVEESNNGKDNAGHGSLVASIVAGNPATVTINDIPSVLSGVAPNANIISYRVCYIGDEADPDDDGCQTSAILAAIDQAIEDGVDVVNHSIGGGAHNPWLSYTSTYAFLNLRAAGTFVVTSAGNAGPGAGTIGSPANAPWMLAAGAATHDRVFASVVENLSGGDTTPPGMLIGESENDGVGIRRIVHAKDYGYPLCGVGEPESGPGCDDNTGLSNPFEPGTFNGEIVVCDRGTYGRVEKGKNLLLAGAGGYILANTDGWGESTYLADLCMPSAHIGLDDADQLRTWLDSGANHQGSISGFSVFHLSEAGDIVASFSSRGPAQSPVEDVMKPDVIAPGVQILGASSQGNNFSVPSNGTSFASPHVAGAAALVKSVHPDWTAAMIASALVTTATPELAVDYDDSEALTDKIGAGRPRLDLSVNAGLYLDISQGDFSGADPRRGGDPKTLNLPGLVDASCAVNCDFQRTVTDMAGGASWTAVIEGLDDGIIATISPQNFTLSSGASETLNISVDLSAVDLVGEWVYGNVRLSSNGLPDTVLPLSVFASGGVLPDEWVIQSDEVSGWQNFTLSELVRMPDATYTSGGLVEPTYTTESLVQDPSGSDIYDGNEGIMTVWHEVPPDTLWLHAETLDSTAEDIDLYVGRDLNNNGRAEANEELCSSESPTNFEYCDLFTPDAGDYWIIAQNWSAGTNSIDDVTIKSAVIGKNTISRLSATGAGIADSVVEQTVRVSWVYVSAAPGTELIGAVGIGTSRDNPNNIGIIPVTFNKTDISNPETLVLMNGIQRGLTLKAGATHQRIVLDIPEGVSSFSLSTLVDGEETGMSEALNMALYRMDFDGAFTFAPFAVRPNMDGDPLWSATGTSDTGPKLVVDNATPGRWYVVLTNTHSVPAEIEIKADLSFTGSPIPLSAGLWQPSSRPDLSQGFDYNTTGDYRAFLWYTYDEDGQPAWYLAAGLAPVGNVWVGELERYTNDGTLQHSTPVGHVSITMLSEQDNIFSFVLFGEEGSDRMEPTSPPECATVNDTNVSYTGLWSRPAVGVGGTSVMVNAATQGYLHYIYDGQGNPTWLLGAGVNAGLPNAEVPLLQFSGYCAVCSGDTPTNQEVGLFTLDYTDEASATWNLNYVLADPLGGTVNRTDDTDKLTVPLVCQ